MGRLAAPIGAIALGNSPATAVRPAGRIVADMDAVGLRMHDGETPGGVLFQSLPSVTIREMGKPDDNGYYSFSAYMAAVDKAAAILVVPQARTGGTVDLCGETVIVPAGLSEWLRSNVRTINGRLLGPAVASQMQPSALIKIWGSLGPAVAYPSAIAAGATDFALDQTFQKDDILLLSNFPTDPGGADNFTLDPPDVYGFRVRHYATQNAQSRRHDRRKELLVVRSSTANSFVTDTGAISAYAGNGLDALQFQKVNPISDVTFQEVTFENIGFYNRLTRDLAYIGCTGYAPSIAVAMSLNTDIHFPSWDCGDSDGRVDAFEACRNINISGGFRNFNSAADNGPIKINGCCDFSVRALISGVRGALGHGVMIDTNYAETPSGYTDLPCLGGDISAVVRDCNGAGINITCDPYAARAANIRVSFTSSGCGYIIKGAENLTMTVNCDTGAAQYSADVRGVKDCHIFGWQSGDIFPELVYNPRNGAQSRGNVALSSYLNGRLRFASGNGSLGVYSSGTWEPRLLINGSTAGVVLDFAKGSYIQIGDEVTLWWSIGLANKGAPPAASSVRIGNSPFVSFGGGGDERAGVCGRGFNMAGLTSAPTITTDPGATTQTLWHWNAAGSAQLTSDNFTNTSIIDGKVTFKVAP